ncbi:MAG: type II toxin-antitoxin system HicA family toxin [Nitrospirota bacterium]|jgi:predicted RNA binding protein YcfA (HicA-like mRNA interferase family)|nr:type II toxin-antitoxin system HicA family toxin [Nitrospirota bacterium]
MPKLKRLSGQDVIKILALFGFVIAGQKGSHVKLVRSLPDGSKQPLTIPAHPELDKGTLKAIFRQASRYIPETELKPHFYSE